jgi:GTP-binding protein HflX
MQGGAAVKQQLQQVHGAEEERAVLVSLMTGPRKNEKIAEQSLQELVRLAETASVRVLDTITQYREAPDPAWFIGKGKVDELKAAVQALEANLAIFDQELSGAQVRNLEQALDGKIIDRTQLILDIFAQRAKTREGIIQVELAQLNYLLPRLAGHGKNLSRLGGGIGTRGPGETKLETDRRHIRERIGELKRQLAEVKRHRSLLRERRRKSGAFQVALVGYTNAGKSTLLNRLTSADVYAENLLFATLDPTSRALKLPGGKEVIVTDTVGFIQNLPHDLVAAFRATLEEVCEADLILHVVDSSSGMREQQMAVVDEVLKELGAFGKDRITVFNKIDLCAEAEIEMLAAEGSHLRISAFSDADLEKLKAAIEERLAGDTKRFLIPADQGELIALAYRLGDVVMSEAAEDRLLLDVRLYGNEFDRFGHRLAAYEVNTDKGEAQTWNSRNV